MRTEARIYTSRSVDLDWTMLPYGPQWLYDQLLSQDDLEHHGVIALRPARWAQLAADVTEPLLLGFLDLLAQRRFVVVDPAYGEVFVRSLIRGDKIYRQPNILRSAADRLGQVKSPLIRDALHAELERIAELPDLTETCALTVKEMLQATQPGAPIPERRPRPRAVAKASGNPAPKPPGNPATKPSRQASPDTSGTGYRSPTDKASTYRPDKASSEARANALPTPDGAPASKASGKGSGKGSPAPSGNPGANGSGTAAGDSSPDPRPKAPGKGSGNPSDNSSTQDRPQTTPDPLPAPNADTADQHRQASRQIIATWLRSTGTQMPSADLVAAVERVLADALQAGHSGENLADVLTRWHQEDGTDPARLAAMTGTSTGGAGKATPTPTPPLGTAPAGRSTSPTEREWQTLDAVVAQIVDPWLSTLPTEPPAETVENIAFHVAEAVKAGHQPGHITAALTAWHRSGGQPGRIAAALTSWHRPGGDDRRQPASPIETANDDADTPAGEPTGSAAPATADEWLTTAKADR